MKKLALLILSIAFFVACNCKDEKCNQTAAGDSVKVACCDSTVTCKDSADCDSVKAECCKKAEDKKCCDKEAK